MQSDLTGGGRVKDTDESGSKSVAGDSGVSRCLFDGVAGGSFFHPGEQHCGPNADERETTRHSFFFLLLHGS